MEIIGVGLSKTGTTSLAAALSMLGFPCVHSAYPAHLEDADAMVDTPSAARYRELDLIYPGSKFILTVRDCDSWLESCRAHWNRIDLNTLPREILFEFRWCRARLFGSLEFEAENHWRCYQRHVAEVRDYFADRPEDLLTINIIGGDRWEPLCEFLGASKPNQPFPNLNRKPQ